MELVDNNDRKYEIGLQIEILEDTIKELKELKELYRRLHEGRKTMKLVIATYTGVTFEIEGSEENYRHEYGCHYLNGESYPDEIVSEVVR